MVKRNLLFLVSVILFASCAPAKEVAYFQDLSRSDSTWQILKGESIRLKPFDALTIIVNTQDPELDKQFNLATAPSRIGQQNSSTNAGNISAYTLDKDGNIIFPVLGELHIQDMTKPQLETYIRDRLIEADLVKDPVVIAEFQNLYVSVIGDVSKPGRYAIDKDQMNILDMISRAGDLTITGKRVDVLILRHEGNDQHTYRVNLCNASQVYASPAFYVKQDDIIYVTPNKKQVRNSTANGNNVVSATFWISLTSSILSMVSVIYALSKK